ncbi:Bardet-Biedl syndrome 12 protein [Eublepharis macularius]|uniref:Bardet-Biedl syndrome 12 protein n=1 Tax=Eublepharis macularius TaxID=481883 RepID=A0AA97L795_EUBMA|nr:Bardet-Biedl syndrome 12 protein [Eublepharis macularius]
MTSKRHLGLQQLSSLASTAKTFLGPVKSSKFIVDERTHGSMLICSAARLLESLDSSNTVGQLLNDAIQAQNKEYKTGTTTLLFLVSAWSNAVLECLEQDIPLSIIVAVMSEGLSSCIEQVQCLTISMLNTKEKLDDVPMKDNDKVINICFDTTGRQIVETKTSGVRFKNSFEIHVSEKEEPAIQQGNAINPWESSPYPWVFTKSSIACSQANLVDASCVITISKPHLDLSNCNKRSKFIHSRYFSSVREIHSQQPSDYFNGSAKRMNELKYLGQLAMSLSHGNGREMKLVQDILRYQLLTDYQIADSHPFQFNISKIVTCCLPGMSESYSCVCPGYVTLLSPEKAAVAKQLQDRPLCIILADGDLTEMYRHLGFNRSYNVRMVFESGNNQANSSGLWVDTVLNILNQYHVDLIFVQGNTCESLEERCLLNNILIINQVEHAVLQAFSNITGVEIVTYLAQVNEHCVGKDVCLNFWGAEESSCMEWDSRVPIVITAKGIHLVTAVLSSPVLSKMQAIEDQFWTCAYRVHHALLDNAVFPGGGAVEFLCLSYLEKLEKEAKKSTGEFHVGPSWLAKSLEQYKPLVFNALACGWHQYLCAVMCNTANSSSEFEASIFIEQHLRKATMCSSPSAYIMEEFRKEKMSTAILEPVGTYEKALKVYDNVTAKIEAWRRALDLVLLVLQTDAEIITGPKRDQLLKSQASEFVFL